MQYLRLNKEVTKLNNMQMNLHALGLVFHLDGDIQHLHIMFETSCTPFEWYPNGAHGSWHSYQTQRSYWHGVINNPILI
jgi:hypothetical protein